MRERHRETDDEIFIDSLPKVDLHSRLVFPGISRDRPAPGETDSRQPRPDAALFAALARRTARRLAAQRVRYAELSVFPIDGGYSDTQVEEMFAGLDQGRRAAERHVGVALRWTVRIPAPSGAGRTAMARHRAAAERAVELALCCGRGAVVGLELAAAAPGHPTGGAGYLAEVFAVARAAGLRSLPRVGRHGGPAAVWEAVTTLGAHRVGHGLGALADPVLVQYLRDQHIAIETCDGGGDRDGPLAAALGRGLAVCLGSAGVAGGTSSPRGAYLRAMRVAALRREEVVQLVRASIGQASLPEPARALLSAELDAAAAAWCPRLPATAPPGIAPTPVPGARGPARRCRQGAFVGGRPGYRASGS
ncbi:putative Adenosine deaminase [Frankia canadensis]|uniref:Putative Adenosine deaminase n=1 Tax=Frankia canadensis TaxID=1836972 RepID=A0A2I2KMI9_9ACTN|nr:hypothetical protein [Frankia canadensis]SNQ46884.1 putative Adenosine deaminase [Frankia canadensis]SOU54174.1 putative Adenosine deaminase [Frankia canadensis]